MKRLPIALRLLCDISAMAAVCFYTISAAHADPFAKGDAGIGKQMVQKNCVTCHASSFGGDGSGIYTREDRKIKDAKGLTQQIRNCNTNLGLKWFEDEELHVAAYLNQTYYKFDK